MPIVQTDIPMTWQRCDTALRELASHPFCRTEVIGRTAYGRTLRALYIGSGSHRVLFCAAHHANEWLTATVLLKFAEDLIDAVVAGRPFEGIDAAALAETTTLCLIPMVDPDGVDLVTGAIAPGSAVWENARLLAARYPAIPFPDGWKANLRGVDLNLNYPAGWLQAREIKFSQGYTRPGPRDFVGRSPLDQAESRSLAEFTAIFDPALVLAYHSQGDVIYWQFRDIYVPGARELGEEFARLSGYTLADTPYESSFAGYKDWFIREFRRPGYTIEVGQGENPLPPEQFPAIYAQNKPLLLRAMQP